MADLSILAGATSQSILVDLYILSTGAPQTGLVYNSTGLTAYYSFAGANATSTVITLATLASVTSAWSSGGFKELDGTNMPGVYRFDVPNAVLAASKGREVVITFNGYSGMAARHIKIELTAVDNQSTAFGLLLAKGTNLTGFNDIAATAIVSGGAITTSGGKVSGVSLVDTLTTYTGNTPQTGDAFARLGAPAGASVSADVAAVKASVGTPQQVGTKYAVTLASTDVTGNLAADLQTIKTQAVTCAAGVTISPYVGNATHALAVDASGFVTFNNTGVATSASQSTILTTLGTAGAGLTNLGDTRIANLDATVSSRAPSSTALSTATWTSARAGYLDNLNVGGAVASHADIAAINQSASKHLTLATVGQYQPGETYTIEMNTFNASTGALVNADTTPTLTATGQISGSLAANLSAATNPATGVYRWTYTPGASPTLEQIRFDGSATISSSTFTLSCYAQTVDAATAVWSSTQAAQLAAVYNKLPTNNIADETILDAAIVALGSPMQAGTAVTLASSQPNYAPAKAGDAMTLTTAYDAAKSAASQASVNAIPTNPLTTLGTNAPVGWINAAAIASAALDGKGDWLLATNYTAPDNTDISAIATSVGTGLHSAVTALGSPMQAGTAVVLAANGLDSVIAEPAAGTLADINARQAIALCLDVLTAILSGAGVGGGTITIRNPGNTLDRLKTTVDQYGNRTALDTFNPPA